MRVVGRGHAAVRATHDKTLELTRETAITERATCVLAVDCTLPDAPLAGPVRVSVSCAGLAYSFEARAVSSWDPGESLVIRRSSTRTPNTFAVDASATAADLPRDLIAALRDPRTEVTVDVDPRPSPPTLVIAAAALPPLAMAAEVAAADTVWDHAPAAGGVAVSGRTLLRTGDPLPRVIGLPHTTRVETVGLHPCAAVVAAAPWAGPVTFAEEAELATVPAGHLLVVATGDPASLLSRAAVVRHTTEATIAADGVDVFVHELANPLPRLPAGTAWIALAPQGESGALDPSVRSAMETMLADGVATKTAAKALTALTRLPQRAAYDAVLALRAHVTDKQRPR